MLKDIKLKIHTWFGDLYRKLYLIKAVIMGEGIVANITCSGLSFDSDERINIFNCTFYAKD